MSCAYFFSIFQVMYQMAESLYTWWLLLHVSTYGTKAPAQRSLAQYKSFWKHFKQNTLINIRWLCHSAYMTGFFLYIGFIFTLLHKGLVFGDLFRIDFHSNILVRFFHLSPNLPKHQILWTYITRLLIAECYYGLKRIQCMVVHNVVSGGFISVEDEVLN